jgi:hypothetical protein
MMGILCIGSIVQIVIVAILFNTHFTIILCYFIFIFYILCSDTLHQSRNVRDLVILGVANCILQPL